MFSRWIAFFAWSFVVVLFRALAVVDLKMATDVEFERRLVCTGVRNVANCLTRRIIYCFTRRIVVFLGRWE